MVGLKSSCVNVASNRILPKQSLEDQLTADNQALGEGENFLVEVQFFRDRRNGKSQSQ